MLAGLGGESGAGWRLAGKRVGWAGRLGTAGQRHHCCLWRMRGAAVHVLFAVELAHRRSTPAHLGCDPCFPTGCRRCWR